MSRTLRTGLILLFTALVVMPADWADAGRRGGGGGGHDEPEPDYENPYGLGLVGPVRSAESDARSRDFQRNVLPAFQSFINVNLREMSRFEIAPQYVLDPTRLYLPLDTQRPVRVYFVHEGAAYRNQLGISIVQAGHGRNGQSELIDPLDDGRLVFPNASYKNPPDGLSPGGPLKVGDFVDLGVVQRGMQLDFFLVSDGASGTGGGDNVLRNFVEFNSDGLQHVIAAHFSEQHPGYILIGFEDIVGGGDLDYNDCLFVVDIGYDITVRAEDLPH